MDPSNDGSEQQTIGVFDILPEIWKFHICSFLTRQELSLLRLTCSFFRKKIIFEDPVWEQWVPFPYHAVLRGHYKALGWEKEAFSCYFGLYLKGRVRIRMQETLQYLPRDLRALDLSDYWRTKTCFYGAIIEKHIDDLPPALEVLYLYCNHKYECVVPEDFLITILRLHPRLKIHFVCKSCSKITETHSLLFIACAANYSQLVLYLLNDFKKEVRETINETPTPLQIVCKNKHYKLVPALLEHGANPNINGKSCHPPLWLAVHLRKVKLVEILLKYGADPTWKTGAFTLNTLGIILDQMMTTEKAIRIQRLFNFPVKSRPPEFTVEVMDFWK